MVQGYKFWTVSMYTLLLKDALPPWAPLSSSEKSGIITSIFGCMMRMILDVRKTLRTEGFKSCIKHCYLTQTLPTSFKNSSFISISLNYLIWMCHMFPARIPACSVSDILLSLSSPSPLTYSFFFLRKSCSFKYRFFHSSLFSYFLISSIIQVINYYKPNDKSINSYKPNDKSGIVSDLDWIWDFWISHLFTGS